MAWRGCVGPLVRSLVFTVGFTGCSFCAAAIWRYESTRQDKSLKSRVQTYFDRSTADRRGCLRRAIDRRWNSLSEGQRTATGIIAANVLVWCCWRVPSLRPTMDRYFTSNPASEMLYSPMLLSAFSHRDVLHLALNMFALWCLCTPAVDILGREQFMAVYLSAGVISDLASYGVTTARGWFSSSLGASGAIMTVLAVVGAEMPLIDGNHLKFCIAYDTLGVLMGWEWDGCDHGAHLGGALFGMWYVAFGRELIWENRMPFVKVWQDLRRRRFDP